MTRSKRLNVSAGRRSVAIRFNLLPVIRQTAANAKDISIVIARLKAIFKRIKNQYCRVMAKCYLRAPLHDSAALYTRLVSVGRAFPGHLGVRVIYRGINTARFVVPGYAPVCAALPPRSRDTK